MARAAHVLANLGKQYDLAKDWVDRAVVLNPNLGLLGKLEAGFQSCVERANAPLRVFTTVLRLDPIDQPEQELGLAWLVRTMFSEILKRAMMGDSCCRAETAMYTLAYIVINAVYCRNECKRPRAAVKKMRS